MKKLVSDLGLEGPKITTKEITSALLRREVIERKRELVMPNYTPDGWWECDVLSVSDAGYASEFEIKTSRGDFFRDFSKEKRQGEATMAKHDRLVLDNRVISEYYFVVPAHMVTLDEIPPYAGVIFCVRDNSGRVRCDLVRSPEKFRGAFFSQQEMTRMRRNAHFRLLNKMIYGRWEP